MKRKTPAKFKKCFGGIANPDFQYQQFFHQIYHETLDFASNGISPTCYQTNHTDTSYYDKVKDLFLGQEERKIITNEITYHAFMQYSYFRRNSNGPAG